MPIPAKHLETWASTSNAGATTALMMLNYLSFGGVLIGTRRRLIPSPTTHL
ncbi:hypothetical protein CROQUDRAFT_99409 [Cronartium quercuum f. sp. fusiforme G11]|uniref:Uncharacterized protein n=1 Tax=Cronartium quercuum f. sp. fusiforme G11 TaxID=708437 RepID=A0A9P6T6Z3_9BASI|nr:hypothetical protein CROQUDRAFT_99409 [Cronartium quercuum f. sp. fusiforme G11]